jgi:hypothetical protein
VSLLQKFLAYLSQYIRALVNKVSSAHAKPHHNEQLEAHLR